MQSGLSYSGHSKPSTLSTNSSSKLLLSWRLKLTSAKLLTLVLIALSRGSMLADSAADNEQQQRLITHILAMLH